MKKLSQLAALVRGAELVGDDKDITSIQHDSRKVEAGTLFVAIPGVHVDGHTFIPQAVKQGAVAVLTTRRDADVPAGVTKLVVPELQPALDAIVP